MPPPGGMEGGPKVVQDAAMVAESPGARQEAAEPGTEAREEDRLGTETLGPDVDPRYFPNYSLSLVLPC